MLDNVKNFANELFNTCINDALKVPDTGTIDVMDVDMSQSLLIDSEILIHELQEIDTKSDQELYKLIELSYQVLLDIEFINKGAHRIQIAKSFMNMRFVSALCNVVSSVQLTDLQKIACNKLIYDYFTSSSKNNNIMNLLYNLGWNINKNCIIGLQGKGMDQNTITYIAVARYSTTDTILATKRVNVIIMNQSLSIMTEQVIVNIYEELFNKSLTSLFTGIMFDAWGDEVEMDDEQEEIYGLINLAILDIVNEVPMGMIVQLLHSYAQSRQFMHLNDKVRFDIHSISQDYSRILEAIQYVEQVDNIAIPHI